MAFFETIRTYRAVSELIDAIANGKLTFVVMTGNPGIGKTNTFRPRLGEKALVIECNNSAFGIYQSVAERPDCDVLCLDDVDGLVGDRRGRTLLKSLGQTDQTKIVTWNTKAADQAGIPRRLTLHCRVLMFANQFKGSGSDFEAVIDRAHCFHFHPTPEEVHEQVRGWIERKETREPIEAEVFQFIGKNGSLIPTASFRYYVNASERARAGLDWKSSLLAQWGADPKFVAVAEIVRLARAGDPTLQTADQRAARFAQWGHGVRSVYFDYQRKIFDMHGWTRLPKLQKPQRPPSKADDKPDIDILADMK